jgi:ubiquinone/menaquinone biosynthesis C-methylase UbiE
MNYDDVASEYDRRYALHSYSSIRDRLVALVRRAGGDRARALELGCGTGQWLADLAGVGVDVAGIDRSAEMLRVAERRVVADLRLGTAEQLPWPSETFDAVVCVNALHHFEFPLTALREAYRVLRPGAVFISIGLDPHTTPGTWYVYEFFPSALRDDLNRFPSRAARLDWLRDAGFERAVCGLAERIVSSSSFADAILQGTLRRSFTSQLTMLRDEQYIEGMQRIETAANRDPSFRLRVDLELHFTEAWKPEADSV